MKNTISLKMNYEFKRAYNRGKYVAGRHLVLYIWKNRLEANRMGITTSKKVGNSVRRNRIRRLIRENYRLMEDSIDVGYDLVFVARAQSIEPVFNDIKVEMEYLFKKLSLFKGEV